MKIYICIYFSFLFLTSCIVPQCKEDMAYLFDNRGRPVKGKTKSDPWPIFMKRCPKDNCHTKKIHCHGNGKYRGSPWWKYQNPAVGQENEDNMDK